MTEQEPKSECHSMGEMAMMIQDMLSWGSPILKSRRLPYVSIAKLKLIERKIKRMPLTYPCPIKIYKVKEGRNEKTNL